ncbi:transposase family protein [Pseudoalteromonas holothuriae]|uniref:transposase family protein n=1 Tax=Pseudoalteromonas holothuriae TaxID=2963714 RepID=UPI0021BE36E7|nr:transposase family protein [Pseudoalteromonas sp. CIP111951]
MSLLSLAKHLETLDDLRQLSKVTYPLFDVLFLTVSAIIAGCEGAVKAGKILKILVYAD